MVTGQAVFSSKLGFGTRFWDKAEKDPTNRE
jgi:hypothetical protein